MRHFRSIFFLWQRGASLSADFDSFNFQDLLHGQQPIKHTERKQEKEKQLTYYETVYCLFSVHISHSLWLKHRKDLLFLYAKLS